MLYTTEEAAVICGFLNAHLAQAGVEVSVRKRNAAFQRGVIMGTLQPDDYRWAENVLCFLKPCWWQLHEDYITASSTNALAFSSRPTTLLQASMLSAIFTILM